MPAFAQPQIESAQADLYFPQIVTGGPTSAQWQTTFTFANRNPAAARCTLFLLSDGGQAFEMNLGSGFVSQFPFTVAGYGSLT